MGLPEVMGLLFEFEDFGLTQLLFPPFTLLLILFIPSESNGLPMAIPPLVFEHIPHWISHAYD